MLSRDPHLRPTDLLAAGAGALGIPLAPAHLVAFECYLQEIERWSARMNLTALRTPSEVVQDGFLDSLACLPLLRAGAGTAVDLGSGAGFPALPLAILRSQVRFTLVEATRKKVTFLRHIVRTLGLVHVRVLHGRAEALARDPEHLGVYHVALARAVAPLPEQARLVRPFLAPGGVFLAQLAADPSSDEAAKALTEAGWIVADAAPGASPRRRVLALRPG